MAPTLFLLCGLPGSGKTTRALELEAGGHGVLINADQWVCKLYPDDAEAAARDHRKGLVEQLQWQLVESLLGQGVSVILDWGVWQRSERDHFRMRGEALGAIVQLIFLDVAVGELHERIAARNRELPPGTFHVEPQELDEWIGWFESPTSDELETKPTPPH